jgi:hypothetical protein
MSAAKAHRYLVSFQRIGLVTQDARTSRYDLGPASLKLGLASLARLDPVRLARERMPALMERIHHTAAIAVWGNHGPTIVHWEESAQSVTANLRLGEQRAEAVRRFMNEQGVALNRMSTISYGQDDPAAPNKTRQGRAQNRRVVLQVLD